MSLQDISAGSVPSLCSSVSRGVGNASVGSSK